MSFFLTFQQIQSQDAFNYLEKAKANFVSFSFLFFLLFLEVLDYRDPKNWKILSE